MRAVWVAAAVVCASVAGRGAAQGPPVEHLPPVAPGPGDGPILPNGTDVSQPLTPVGPVVVSAEPVDASSPVQRVEEVQKQKYTRRGPLGPAWDTNELLFWWAKAAPVPPLVSTSRGGQQPILGAPGTTLVVGNRALGNPAIAGGRFTFGWSVNNAETLGLELGYFFLGSRTDSVTVGGRGSPRNRVFGLPFIDAESGREAVLLLNNMSSAYVTTTTRLQGAEGNAVANLIDNKGLRVHGIVGYRFLQVNEGLTVELQRSQLPGLPADTFYDEFSTSNRFHGAQLGLHADVSRGAVFCELTGKLALGRVFEVVRIDGAFATDPALPPPFGGQRFPEGAYARESNIGRYARGAFAVVPEATFKVGVKLGDSGRFYVGYNFLYLGDAVRPGDQIDRTVNPLVGLDGPDRPRPLLTRSDYWVQGLVIGLETRY